MQRRPFSSPEIVPGERPGRKGTVLVEPDEGPRPDTSTGGAGTPEAGLRAERHGYGRERTGLDRRRGCPGRRRRGHVAERHACNRWRASSATPAPATDPLWLFEAPELALTKLLQRDRHLAGRLGPARDQRSVRGADRGQRESAGLGLGPRQCQRRRDRARPPAGSDRRTTRRDLAARVAPAGQARGIAGLCHGGGGAVAMAFELVWLRSGVCHGRHDRAHRRAHLPRRRTT